MTKRNSNSARGLTMCCLVGCHKMLVMLSLVALMCVTWTQGRPAEQEEWLNAGRQELRRAMKVSKRQNTNLARNIILFVGDGMGISTVTASRIRGGQLRGEDGEENLLFFERFPHVGLVKTYSADSQVTGSAAAGSAILTGVKINSGVLGCDSRVKKGNCTDFTPDTKLSTILHAFIDEGLSTGIVTNSRITHATPASAYAQTPHRAWEGDVDLPDDEDCDHVDDIAKQLILNNADIKVFHRTQVRRTVWPYYRGDFRRSWDPRRCYGDRALCENLPQERDYNAVSCLGEETGVLMKQSLRQESLSFRGSRFWELDIGQGGLDITRRVALGLYTILMHALHAQYFKDVVILGGGRRYFLDNCTQDPVLGTVDPHQRRDGLNLVDEWVRDKINRNASYRYVWEKSDFDTVDSNTTDFLLGLFNPSHMDFDLHDSSQGVNRTEPTLVEMTQKAIEVLSKDPKGYFLMVEGARIDFGHHANSAITAITETLDLDEAVHTAVRMTGSHETLIIVTADHSHAFAIQGYAPRGHDILGTADPGLDIGPLDGLPYTTLGYTNGPVFGREDLTHVDTGSPGFRQSGCIPVSIETHAGEDVSVYALGPMAHLFHATHEQNYLYHVMEYAACVGYSKQYCRNSKAHWRMRKPKTSKGSN